MGNIKMAAPTLAVTRLRPPVTSLHVVVPHESRGTRHAVAHAVTARHELVTTVTGLVVAIGAADARTQAAWSRRGADTPH